MTNNYSGLDERITWSLNNNIDISWLKKNILQTIIKSQKNRFSEISKLSTISNDDIKNIKYKDRKHTNNAILLLNMSIKENDYIQESTMELLDTHLSNIENIYRKHYVKKEVKKLLPNFQTIVEEFINTIFLLKNVTAYANINYAKDDLFLGSDILYAITDQSAYKILHNVPSTYIQLEDRGIDAILLFSAEGQLVNSNDTDINSISDIILFQSKNSGTPSGFEQEFKNAPNNFRDILSELALPYNSNIDNIPKKFLLDILGNKLNVLEGSTVTNVYITAQKPSDNSLKKAVKWINDISSFKYHEIILEMNKFETKQIPERVLVTETVLNDQFSELEKKIRTIGTLKSVGEKKLEIIEFNYEPFYSDKVTSYQGMAYLNDYVNILPSSTDAEKFEELLIADNVRNNQGDRKAANKAIRDVLQNSEQNSDSVESYIDFWWLNNGITIIAESINQTSPRTIIMKNPQIVNGQQTSRQIFQNKDIKFNPNWKIRITFLVIPGNDSISHKIKNKIILGVNTQTPVYTSDILGLTPEIRNISSYIYTHSNKKIGMSIPSENYDNDTLDVPYQTMSQYIIAGFLKKPGAARRGISVALNNNIDNIFTEKNTSNNTLIIESWIHLIKQVNKYIQFFKEKNWLKTYNIEKNFKLGDNFAILGIFTLLVKNINAIEKEVDNNGNEKVIFKIENTKDFQITKKNFTQAIKEWHSFMNVPSKTDDPDKYTKSKDIDNDINK